MLKNCKPVVLAMSMGLAALASCGSANTASSPTVSSVAISHTLLAPAAADTLLHSPPAGLIVLDVRTPAEFATGHIAGAIDLDLNGTTFAADVAKLDPATPYFVYCHSGNRSAQAVTYMQAHGIVSIYELQGGITAWQTAGLAVVN